VGIKIKWQIVVFRKFGYLELYLSSNNNPQQTELGLSQRKQTNIASIDKRYNYEV